MDRIKIKILTLSFIALLSSCQVGPKYTPPSIGAPEKWKYAEETPQPAKHVDHWWEIFEDPQLDDLAKQALKNNKSLHAALERINQANALAGIASSERFPQLNLEPSYANEGVRSRLYDPERILREHQRQGRIPLVASYEVDLWKKVQKTYESAALNVEAEKEAFRTALLVLTTDLAAAYFQLRTLDANIYLLEDTIQSREHACEIVRSRYKAKITDYSDVSRADFECENTQAKYFSALRLRNLTENAIAVLLGIPASGFKIESTPLKKTPPVVPSGIPSSILLQRPDIAQAEYTMASVHALIGVAYASFFPSISLTGALGFSSPEFKDFITWKSRLWGFGANAIQPIFDAGRLGSNLEFAKSKFREVSNEYQQQVLKAFQEVEDALTNLEGLKNEYNVIEQSVEAAKITYKIAFDKYKKGTSFYLDVVDSERRELDAERALIELLGQRYAATIQLIKALGGRWTTN